MGLFALALTPALALAANSYTWSGAAGDNDWMKADNYAEKAVPSAGDVVKVPDGVTATVSSADAASWALASSLDRIAPQTNGSRVILDVAEGVTNDFYAGISYNASWESKLGTIEKTGKGVVRFRKATGGQNNYRSKAFVVSGGRADFSNIGVQQYFGVVTVAEGATFCACYQITWITELKGNGTVTSPTDYEVRVMGGTAASPTVVEPLVTGPLVLVPIGYARINRKDNTFTSRLLPYGEGAAGLVELSDIGMKGVPSPTGKNSYIGFNGVGGGKFRYIGENDTVTDKNVLYENSSGGTAGTGVFDAGPHGGITFDGAWGWTTKSWGRTPLWGRFILKGDNESPCVINGKIGYSAVSGLEGHLGMLKQGTGKWTFANAANFFDGTIGVDAGTLGFTSIAEAGKVCALGTATHLKNIDKSGLDTSASAVPYAIRLGSAATLEYSGTERGRSTTRPVALAGNARISNASAKPLTLAGVTALNEGTALLTLNAAEAGVTNYIGNVTDAGSAKLGIVKEGAGTYVLCGTNTWTGPLTVKGGTLVLRKPTANYTWFRLVLRDYYFYQYKLGRVGFFDANGYRQNIGLKYVSNSYTAGTHSANFIKPYYERLEPGQFGWGWDQDYNIWERTNMSPICTTGECWDESCHYVSCDEFGKEGAATDPTRWVKYDFRMTNGTPAIAYYDLAVVYAANSSLSNYIFKAWTLLGSTDGLTWDKLHAEEDSHSTDENQILRQRNSGNYWMGQNCATKWHDATTKHNTAKLQPIASAPTQAVPFLPTEPESITVENGGVLEAEGEITLSKFRAAYGATAGTVKGFKLAANCQIEVTDIPKGTAALDVPIAFAGASPEEAEWTVMDNGKVSRRYEAVVRDGRLRLIHKGFAFIIK